jgi:SAM-dependent methyltransferase
VKIDLGGGRAPAQGHVNLDAIHGEGEWKRRLQDGIPVPDESVESIYCSHLMEHIPSGQERIDAFNEAWRVLIPGGTFEVIVPLVGTGWGAIADPTHVSLWCYESFLYFTGEIGADADYGIRLWEGVSYGINNQCFGQEGRFIMRKPG